MREFVMPAGRFSGRRYVYLTPTEYRALLMEVADTGPLNLVYVNEVELLIPKKVREMVHYLQAMNAIREEQNRRDRLTLVTSRPIVWDWLYGLALEGVLDYTVAITKSDSMFDIKPLPESELILELTTSQSALWIPKMPIHIGVQCSIMCTESRIHWALGALKQSGRPDISIYVNLKSLSPDMRGAST